MGFRGESLALGYPGAQLGMAHLSPPPPHPACHPGGFVMENRGWQISGGLTSRRLSSHTDSSKENCPLHGGTKHVPLKGGIILGLGRRGILACKLTED